MILEEILNVVRTFTNNCRISGDGIEIFDVAFKLIKEIYNELMKRGFNPVFVQTQKEATYLIY